MRRKGIREQVIGQSMALRLYGIPVRIYLTPGHDLAAPGNQAAHEAAPEARTFLSSAGPAVAQASGLHECLDTP